MANKKQAKRSGGIDVSADEVKIGGDAIGRDKHEQHTDSHAVFDFRGQTVGHQINVAGNYIEINGDGNVIGNNSSSQVIKHNTFSSFDPEVKRALAEIQRNLKPIDQRETQDLLDAVRQLQANDAAALSELRGMVDGVRRGLINLQSRELPKMDQSLRQAIEEIQATLKDDSDVSTGLELTIPIVPLFLEYKTHLDFDVEQWWANLKKKLRGG